MSHAMRFPPRCFHPFSRFAALLAPALIGAVWLIAATGCNILGPAGYIVMGQGEVDAKYTLEDRPTVVFIDDRDNLVNPVMFRRVIADVVSRELMTRELVTRTISPNDAMQLVARYDTNKEVMPIDAIGQAVGAEQIIYVEMISFDESIDGTTPRAAGSCRVRVIDVENRTRLFPAPQADVPYHPVQVMTEEFSTELYRSRTARMQISEALAERLGDQIAKLFYRHESRELGRRLDPK